MTSSGRLLAGALLTLCAAAPALAQEPAAATTVPDSVAASVATAIAAQWDVAPDAVRLEWGRLPQAARLPADVPFRLLGRGDDGWFAVVFEPEGGPAAARVRAALLDTVVVAARPIAAGTLLEADDIDHAARLRWGAPSQRRTVSADTGWIARRAFASGDPLTEPGVGRPPVVRAGEPVRLEWQRGGVFVALDGVALNAAALGEPVRVRLDGRGGSRSGTATANGTVRIGS